MKKIIDGKRYNTETAIEIGEASSHYRGDFRFWEATLYKTKGGRFFLAGEGGPMTRFARSCGDNTTCGGEGLFPMSKGEALEWAERHLDAEAIEEHFADELEDA